MADISLPDIKIPFISTADIRITGKENRPNQPSFYFPNRLDCATLRALVEELGGSDQVVFLVEDVLQPDAGMMHYMHSLGKKILSFNFRKADSRKLREQMVGLMGLGLDIIYVPGHPNSIIGCLADIPMPFMRELAALHISPVPVYVGTYRNDLRKTFCTDGKYDWADIRILPKLSPGPLTGERVQEAWLEASADSYSTHPILETSLARLIVEGFRKHAKITLEDGMDNTNIAYGKLLGVSMALARYFKKTVEEPRLGIIMPPGKAGVIINYACVLAGIVPVNINYTSSDAAFESIVRQSGIKHFVSARAFMSKLPQFPWPKGDAIIHIDRVLKSLGMKKIAPWVAFAKLAPMPVIARTFELDKRHGDDEAALLFTSGSSGEPKGVPLTHRMVIANCTQILSKVDLEPGSALLCSLPIFHSFGMTVCTFLPPLSGFRMVTYPSPLEAKELNRLIEQHQCKLVVMTPTFARSLVRRAHEHNYDSVRYFVVGAEKLQKAVADEFVEKCHIELKEGYGLTETAPVVGVNLDTTGPTEEQPFFVPGSKYGSIGHIFPGMGVRITDPDDDNKVLPLSEQGMIWFKGANVFKGYIGRDDLNAEIFKDGWFKTGDLGSVDLNNFLTLAGRRSRFSKIAGEMVPHEVVENAIVDFLLTPEGEEGGRTVAIVGVPDAQKGEALVLLSCIHNAQLTQALDAIRSHLADQGIPRLWVPREIIPVEAIPMLPTGKMDLKGCQQLAYEALGLPL